MQSPRYALVAYVTNEVGEFVESLRRELHPELPHLPAHITILPPRTLQASESSALEILEDICSQLQPFEVGLGEPATFIPTTPTVFIRLQTPETICDLHARLSTRGLRADEEWPFVPHLTIAKLTSQELAQRAYQTARERWAKFHGSKTIKIQELTFVRESKKDCWEDVAELPLGSSLVGR